MSVEVAHVSVAFGAKVVLDDFSLKLPERGVYGLLGPSGCGKTTLLDVLSGLLVPTSGAADGIDNLTIARVFQDNRLIPWVSVAENIACVLTKPCLERWSHDPTPCQKLGLDAASLNPTELTDALLDVVGLKGEAQALPDELSGGMQKRLGLARALAADAELVLLDEPTVGLDDAAAVSLLDAAMELWRGRLVVFVTHDRALADRYATEIAEVAGPPLKLTRAPESCA